MFTHILLFWWYHFMSGNGIGGGQGGKHSSLIDISDRAAWSGSLSEIAFPFSDYSLKTSHKTIKRLAKCIGAGWILFNREYSLGFTNLSYSY